MTNALQILTVFVWSVASPTFGGLYAYVGMTLRRRASLLGTEGAKRIAADYIAFSIIGVVTSIMCTLTLAVASLWPKSPIAVLLGTLVVTAIPILFLLHSIYLFRRVRLLDQ